MNSFTIEVVATNVQSCINAEKGGAGRIELCSALSTAGLTPSSALISQVKKHVHIPVFVMIRPREGDFCYSDLELDVMRQDIEHGKVLRADGFVIGVLNPNGTVNAEVTKTLVDLCRPLPVTFHRAIDITPDIHEAVETVIDCGCSRILTSGGKRSALEGRDIILDMNIRAGGRINIMPGGNIRPDNLEKILSPGLSEYHLSGRMEVRGSMSSTLFDMDWSETDSQVISNVVARAKQFFKAS